MHHADLRLSAKDYNLKMMKCLTASDASTRGIREIFAMWEQMHKTNCKPNAITYNFVIKACFMSQKNAVDGFRYFEMMKDKNIAPSLVTFNEIIKVSAWMLNKSASILVTMTGQAIDIKS